MFGNQPMEKKCDFDLYLCCPLFNNTAFSYDVQ